MNRSISANQSLVRRFQADQKYLLTLGDAGGVEKLDKKIRLLVNDNERNLKLLEKPPSVETPKSLTGADWISMSPSQKQEYVEAACLDLQQQGVVLTLSAEIYLEALDDFLSKNPDHSKYPLQNLLVYQIYGLDPPAREGIKRISEGYL